MRNRKSDTILLDATGPLHTADEDVTVNLNVSSYPAVPIGFADLKFTSPGGTTGDHTSNSRHVETPNRARPNLNPIT